MKDVTPKLPVVHAGVTGRPPYTDAVRKRILANLRMGDTRDAAVGHAGVAMATFHRWLADIENFREDVASAESTAEHRYTAMLIGRAHAGDTAAIKFWLERRKSKNWRERTTIENTEGSLEEELEDAIDADARRQRLQDLADEALRRAASSADGSPTVDGPDAGSPD